MKKSTKKAAGKVITKDEINRFCLLAQILNFEKYWACYSFSEGVLYSKEVKDEAKKVVDLFTRIYETKELVAEDGRILPVDKWEGRQFIQAMSDWMGDVVNKACHLCSEANKSKQSFFAVLRVN